jgi:hypothetical protein
MDDTPVTEREIAEAQRALVDAERMTWHQARRVAIVVLEAAAKVRK